MSTIEEKYRRQEAEAEVIRRRKLRRQPLILIGLVNALILLTAATVTVDLRRLQSPGGTALAWVQAAAFGDCEKYRTYSVADPAASAPDGRTQDERCRDLRAATADNRADSLRVKLTLGEVVRTGDDAQVSVSLTQDGNAAQLSLHLERSDGRWRVVRDAGVCAQLVCS